MQLVVGVLMDRYGPRNLLAVSSILCGLGIYMFAATTNLVMGEIGRLLIGFGSSFAFVGVLKIAALWMPKNKFAFISGSTMAIGMIGGILGETAVTSLVTYEGWKLASIHAAVFGLILSFLLYVIIKDHKKYASPGSTSSFAEVISAMLKMIKNKQTWMIGTIGCFMWFPISIYAEAWGFGFLDEALKFSREQSSIAVSFIFLGMACGGPITGALSDYLQKRKLLIIIGSILTTIVISILLYMPNLTINQIYCLNFLIGLLNSPQVLVFAMSKEISGKNSTGTAIAITNMMVMLAGVLQPISGYILRFIGSSKIVNGAPVYSLYAYKVALSIIPIALFITVVIAFFLKESYSNTYNKE